MSGVGGLVVLAALMGQPYCGSSGYGYGYGYQQYYNVPYVQAKLTVVATEPAYGQSYAGLLGQDARYELKAKEDAEFKAELLATLKALANKPPPPEVQVFQAPQQAPQYAPAPSYGPSPQSPQAAPQQPLYGPTKQAPGKSFSPAPLPPQVPQTNPGNFGAGGGDWGGAAPAQDGQQIFTSLLGNRCASCHSSDAPSGGVAFFDANGEPLALSASQVRKADRAVQTGRMPKNGALPPGEAQAWDESVISMYQSLYQQARR